jgi:hypothetical protein
VPDSTGARLATTTFTADFALFGVACIVLLRRRRTVLAHASGRIG